MAKSSNRRPRLRPIETIFVPDPKLGRVLMLRDTEGITPNAMMVPAHLAAVVGRFSGTRSVEQIATEASRATGETISAALVDQIADELDAGYFLESERFRARRAEVVQEFTDSPSRPASHAGGAYHGDATKLRRFIEDECLAKAPERPSHGKLVGLCAPHMDLWRASTGYGHAYRVLHERLSEDVDTFVLLGTCHAAMEQPFAVCAKRFETPLGGLEPDLEALGELGRKSRFDVRADEFLHKREHSLEFQAVFLRHALGERADGVRIVPILCGLGAAQSSGRDPALDAESESFLAALGELVESRAGRVMVLAGADLAHVGPRFGDPAPYDEGQRGQLRARDGESIDLALAGDAPGFFEQVASDLDERRVCGLGPLYTLLRVLSSTKGERLHYTQHIDPEEGSIVSHASLAWSR